MTRVKRFVSLLLASSLLAGSFLYGFVAHRNNLFPAGPMRAVWNRLAATSSSEAPAGHWSRARSDRTLGPTGPTEDELSRLLTLGYLRGAHSAPQRSGVTVHLPGQAYAGFNLYVSGHGTEAVLIDMDGRRLHRWALRLTDVPGGPSSAEEELYWRRVRAFPNGDLLALSDYAGIVRMDLDSRPIWAYRGRTHHDFDIDAEGNVYVLAQRNRLNPRTRERNLIADDRILVLSPTGELLDDLSVYDCFDQSVYASVLDYLDAEGDVFHTNTLTLFDGSQEHQSPLFRKGNVLISLRMISTIAIIDPTARKVVWALAGLWQQQHEPVLLESGRLLIFDNRPGSDRSRVVEFDPFSQEVVWEFAGTEETPFYSRIAGSNQRLPNGNTLITESDYGRAFEVTGEGGVVWEFLNPHRAGPDDELIATLFDVVRLPPDFPSADFVSRGRLNR